jgi:aconitate hydratase
LLPLTFAVPGDYDRIKEDDLFDINLNDLAPGREVKLTIKHSDGTTEEITLHQTLNRQQIDWFKAGSALNLMAEKGEG